MFRDWARNARVELQLLDIDAYGKLVHLVHPRMQALDSSTRFMLAPKLPCGGACRLLSARQDGNALIVIDTSSSGTPQNGLTDGDDSYSDQGEREDGTAKPDRELTALAAHLLSDQEGAMRDNGCKYHQEEVSRHRVGMHAAYHEEDAEQYLEVEHAGERCRQVTGEARRTACGDAVDERDQRGQGDEQDQISESRVRVEEDVHG